MRKEWSWSANGQVIKLVHKLDLGTFEWSTLCVLEGNLVYHHKNKASLEIEWPYMSQALILYNVYCEPLTSPQIEQYIIPEDTYGKFLITRNLA